MASKHLKKAYTTPCPSKKEATLIFDITLPSVDIFLQFEAFCLEIIYA